MPRSTLRIPVSFAALVAALLVVLAGPAAALSPAAPPTLRLDGIGPLRLGMRSDAALRTGWLARRGRGCELGGPPIPVTYRLTGPRALGGIAGFAEFRFGRLRNLSFTGGVRTAVGVVPGSTPQRRMVARYRSAGFTVATQFVDTFGGTFVTVRRGRRSVLGGFATRGRVRTIGIPYVPTCE
jgi:hypothetical protein